MYCHNCGKEIPDTAINCPECGAAQDRVQPTGAQQPESGSSVPPTAESQPVSSSGKPATDAKKKKKKKILTIVLIVFGVLMLLSAIVGLSGGDEPSSPVGTSDEASSADAAATTKTQIDENLPFDQQLQIAADNLDFAALNRLAGACPDDMRAAFSEKSNQAAMTYLCNHKYEMYACDFDFFEKAVSDLAFVATEGYKADLPIVAVYKQLKDLAGAKSIVDEYEKNTKSVMNVTLLQGDEEVVRRIQAHDSDEYLDEYLVKVNWMDDDYIVIRSTTPIEKGPYYGYVKYVEDKDYVKSDGFEYTYPVYTPLTDAEVKEYQQNEGKSSELHNRLAVVDDYFYAYSTSIEKASATYATPLTASNYFGVYGGQFADNVQGRISGSENILTLYKNMTFKMRVNTGYGFTTYDGVFSKDGNTIVCKNYTGSVTFTIAKDTLVIDPASWTFPEGLIYDNMTAAAKTYVRKGEQPQDISANPDANPADFDMASPDADDAKMNLLKSDPKSYFTKYGEMGDFGTYLVTTETGSPLNVRASWSQDSEVVGQLRNGEFVTGYGIYNGWVYIETQENERSDFLSGWVKSDYVGYYHH